MRLHILLILSMTALVGCASFFKEDQEKATLHLRIGTSHLMNGNYPAALNELLLAESIDDTNPLIQNNLALAYFVRDRFDLAEVHVRKALKLDPAYTDARNNLSRILIERGRFQEAINEAKIVAKDLTYPEPAKPLLNLGMAYFKLGDFQSAQQELSKAIDFQRENCQAQSLLGRTFYELKNYARAADQLDRAVSFCQKSQFDEPHYYSALSYFQTGDVRKAEARMEEVIKLYPGGKYQERARAMLETMRR
jgi:Tfp pilus assembly protein PilF